MITRTYQRGSLRSSRLAGRQQLMQVFHQGTRERGLVKGRNYLIENFYSDGKARRVTVIAAEIVSNNVDLIVTAGTPGLLAVKAATTIPILFFFVGEPVGSGLVGGQARAGGQLDSVRRARPWLVRQAARTVSRPACQARPVTGQMAFSRTSVTCHQGPPAAAKALAISCKDPGYGLGHRDTHLPQGVPTPAPAPTPAPVPASRPRPTPIGPL